MSEETFARKGDVVTCENGHKICVVAKEIKIGDISQPDDFEDWQIVKPEAGDQYKPCKCGTYFIRNNPANEEFFQIHLNGEWKP